MASLTAMDTIDGIIGVYDWHSNAQWLIRQGGTTAMAGLLRRSEDTLRSRGTWQSADAPTATNKALGLWTMADATAASLARVSKVLARLQANGIVEYSSSYFSVSMQEIELGIMHAPSAAVVTAYQTLQQIFYADLLLHYHPASNTFGAPTARNRDLVSGTHSVSAHMHTVNASRSADWLSE